MAVWFDIPIQKRTSLFNLGGLSLAALPTGRADWLLVAQVIINSS
jgi:hypothetical protein